MMKSRSSTGSSGSKWRRGGGGRGEERLECRGQTFNFRI